MINLKQLNTKAKITWCPGCGNFGILTAIKNAIVELNLSPYKVVIVSGIGCHGKITDYINVNSFHTIHGRVLPLATGIKIANHELTVIGFAGDGDAYAIGIGHLPHAARRNVDIKYIVHNNMVFALTTGQFTPTTPTGLKTKSTPYGNIENPLNPILLALASGASFVARGFAGDVKHLTYIFKQAILHKGFAFIDVLQPCYTFYNTYDYFRKRIYKLEDVNHNTENYNAALEKAQEWEERIPIGIFYKKRELTFMEKMTHIREALTKQDISNIDIKDAYKLL